MTAKILVCIAHGIRWIIVFTYSIIIDMQILVTGGSF